MNVSHNEICGMLTADPVLGFCRR